MAEMDLKQYDMQDLLLTAMKAETDSRDVYRELAARVKNAMLKDRLEFLPHDVLAEGRQQVADLTEIITSYLE